MNTSVGFRKVIGSKESIFVFKLPESKTLNSKISFIELKESFEMVDGLGGETWDGEILLTLFLSSLNWSSCVNVIELGCGSGLAGIFSSLNDSNVILTDHEVDLAEINIKKTLDSLLKLEIFQPLLLNSQTLEWKTTEITSLLTQFNTDIIIGAEIACLRKQQPYLVSTIKQLSSDSTIIFITFDDIPPVNGNYHSVYEKEMDERMTNLNYQKAVVYTGHITWKPSTEQSNDILEAFVINLTNNYTNDLLKLNIKQNIDLNETNEVMSRENYHIHHIVMYYQSNIIQICEKCEINYFNHKLFDHKCNCI